MIFIDKIMAEKVQQKQEKETYMNTLKKEINASNFFTEDDDNGFVSKEVFLGELHRLGRYDLQKIEDFMEKVSNKVSLYIAPFPKMNEAKGIAYRYVKPLSKQVVSGYQLPEITGMKKLIDCYAQGYYNFNLSLEELYSQANS